MPRGSRRPPLRRRSSTPSHPSPSRPPPQHNSRTLHPDAPHENHPDGADEEDSDSHLLLTEYEKQRLKRIAENSAKLASLNIPAVPSSSPRVCEPEAKKESDDEYLPGGSASDGTSDSDDEQDVNRNNQNDESGAVEENRALQQDESATVDEDRALQQALALSLEVPESDTTSKKPSKSRKRSRLNPDNKPKMRKKGQQEQFSDDDIAAIFSVFDEHGKGKFSLEELERIAQAHDFTWSKEEVEDMINIFDHDKDGELDIYEFRSIFKRAGMAKQKSVT